MKANILLMAVLTAGMLSANAQSVANTEKSLQASVNYAKAYESRLQEEPMYTQPVYILDERTPSEKIKAKRKKRLSSFFKFNKRKSSGSF